MLPWIFLILQLLFALLFFYLSLAFLTGAPFVPSTNSTAAIMIKLANIKKGMRIYDLGSGEGKLLFSAAKNGATAIGLEINPYLVCFTNMKALFSPYRKKIHVYWKNFWGANYKEADIVFVYLLPWRMEQLEQKLIRELKPGSKIVSNSFIFPHLTCTAKNADAHVYVFTMGKKQI